MAPKTTAKPKNDETVVIAIQPLKKNHIHATLVGDSDLILHKRPRSVDEVMLFKQSHPKGTKVPESIDQPYNLWERLITSIHWRDAIDAPTDWSQYNEDMWKDLMANNAPQIVGKAFKDTWAEAFISFFKDATGLKGTDFKRSVVLHGTKMPITFGSVTYDQHLTPNNGINPVPVIAEYNLFSGWRCEIDVSHVSTVIPTDTIANIINAAGEFIGVGTRRAEGFGRYHIEDMTITQS